MSTYFAKASLSLLTISLMIGFCSSPARADDPPPIDWDRARQLYQREQRGDKLSPDEQAYLSRAKAERQKMQNGVAQGGRSSTGLTPLTDLKEKYKGEDGGLYGNGGNEPPAALAKAAQAAVARIVPLDRNGKPAADGKIVLLAIGMSKTTQEFSRFKEIADRDPQKSRRLSIVDGAQGGKDAAAWIDPRGGPGVWETADRRLAAQSVTPKQVQIVWIKQALIQPARLGEFPKHARVLADDIQKIMGMAKERYPNLQLAYLSSRIYAGYASTPLNPEPYAYESAYAVRWVIDEQMTDLGDAAKGQATVRPVILWGPYLWADGIKARQFDKLVWNHEDLSSDGTHPSNAGREKVAQLLLEFFKNDTTAKGWFLQGEAK